MKWPAWLALIALAVLLVALFIVGRPEAQTVGVTVQWTAPGDDGNVGRAAQYDLRYRTTPIIGTDTLTWWNGAAQVTNEPQPSVSGVTDSIRVLGLQASTQYRFIIKTADEVPNWSGYSNVAVITTPDLVAPAAIVDLRGAP